MERNTSSSRDTNCKNWLDDRQASNQSNNVGLLKKGSFLISSLETGNLVQQRAVRLRQHFDVKTRLQKYPEIGLIFKRNSPKKKRLCQKGCKLFKAMSSR